MTPRSTLVGRFLFTRTAGTEKEYSHARVFRNRHPTPQCLIVDPQAQGGVVGACCPAHGVAQLIDRGEWLPLCASALFGRWPCLAICVHGRRGIRWTRIVVHADHLLATTPINTSISHIPSCAPASQPDMVAAAAWVSVVSGGGVAGWRAMPSSASRSPPGKQWGGLQTRSR